MYDATKLPSVSGELLSARGGEVVSLDVGDSPEPISLQQAKDHLRVVIPDEDDYISALIVAARQMAEGRLNRTLKQRTLRVAFDASECRYRLPKPPLVSVDSITYGYGDDAVSVDDVSYRLDDISDPPRLVPLAGWPILPRISSGIVVEYTAGYADGEVPRPIIQWMLLVIGSLYENRETMSAGVQIYAIPDDFTSWLLQPYMVYE